MLIVLLYYEITTAICMFAAMLIHSLLMGLPLDWQNALLVSLVLTSALAGPGLGYGASKSHRNLRQPGESMSSFRRRAIPLFVLAAVASFGGLLLFYYGCRWLSGNWDAFENYQLIVFPVGGVAVHGVGLAIAFQLLVSMRDAVDVEEDWQAP